MAIFNFMSEHQPHWGNCKQEAFIFPLDPDDRIGSEMTFHNEDRFCPCRLGNAYDIGKDMCLCPFNRSQRERSWGCLSEP